MLTRDRSKRKYDFGDLTAPTKLEHLKEIYDYANLKIFEVRSSGQRELKK